MHFLKKYQVVEFHTRHLPQKPNRGFKEKSFFDRILLSDLQMKRQETEKLGFHNRMKHMITGMSISGYLHDISKSQSRLSEMTSYFETNKYWSE